MIGRLLFAAVLLVAIAGPHAHAVEPSERLADPALEARARSLSKELRCLVCQNQSIDESNADLAHDLRLLLRQRLVAGDTDQQVLDYIDRSIRGLRTAGSALCAADLAALADTARAGVGWRRSAAASGAAPAS